VTWTHIREYQLKYFFIIICLYSQVCNEFFFGVFGLVLVPEYLHSQTRRPVQLADMFVQRLHIRCRLPAAQAACA